MAKPPMTSQAARMLYVPRASKYDQKLSFYLAIIRKHLAEAREIMAAGRDVRNTLRVLNARHKFIPKTKRQADMKFLRQRPGIAEILRSKFPEQLMKMAARRAVNAEGRENA